MLKQITILLMSIIIIFLKKLLTFLAFFFIPLACFVRGFNKTLECIDEYEKDFESQLNNII